MEIELSKDEINLLDSVLSHELIRLEFPNGKQITFDTEKEKAEYKLLSDLLRKIEDACISVN